MNYEIFIYGTCYCLLYLSMLKTVSLLKSVTLAAKKVKRINLKT